MFEGEEARAQVLRGEYTWHVQRTGKVQCGRDPRNVGKMEWQKMPQRHCGCWNSGKLWAKKTSYFMLY